MILPLRLEQALMRPNPNPGFDVTSVKSRKTGAKSRKFPVLPRRRRSCAMSWRTARNRSPLTISTGRAYGTRRRVSRTRHPSVSTLPETIAT